METSGIKSWSEPDRPREKLLLHGKHTLSTSELIAILIRSGTRDETAVEVARSLLKLAADDLSVLARMSVSDLARPKGMGPVKAITLVAALELGRRKAEGRNLTKVKIGSSSDVANVFQHRLADLDHEEFWLLLLNRANQIITKCQLSKGGVTGTVVDPKMVFRMAIEHLASGIILCHNHPSGNNQPSDADIRLTRKLKDAGALLDIHILDHIIIAGSDYYSFSDNGKM
ncbi:MAG TPA: DNA repair protein RadC [Bacteroidia bacterium]|nr:DNA repair protein RadC [Bacteroidia bacterium]